MSNKVIELTQESFEQEINNCDKPVIIDFWASWCGPCRAVAPIMNELAEEYDGKAKICKVNVDEEGELAAKFRIMSIPTILLYKNGQMVERVIGARSKDEFAKLIEANL